MACQSAPGIEMGMQRGSRQSMQDVFSLRYRSPASRQGRGKRGFHRRATNSLPFAICCFKCAHVATSCSVLPHVAQVFPWKLIRGNCGTSVATPFVPNPSGNFRIRSRESMMCIQWQKLLSSPWLVFCKPTFPMVFLSGGVFFCTDAGMSLCHIASKTACVKLYVEYVPPAVPAFVNKHSSWVSLCHANQQQKLPSSHWFGTLKAYLSNSISFWRGVFSQTPVSRESMTRIGPLGRAGHAVDVRIRRLRKSPQHL